MQVDKTFGGNIDKSMDHNNVKLIQRKSFRRYYDIQADGKRIGRLTFSNILGPHAIGEIDDETYVFMRTGLTSEKIIVRHADSRKDAAVYYNNIRSSGGVVYVQDKRRCNVYSNSSQTNLKFTTDTGSILMSLASIRSSRLSMNIQLFSKSPESPLLILLGGYIIVTISENNSSIPVLI
jgi:hypothetical protein